MKATAAETAAARPKPPINRAQGAGLLVSSSRLQRFASILWPLAPENGGSSSCPNVLDGIEFGRFWRQGQNGDVFGDHQIVGHVPSGLVHDEDGVRIVGDVSRYLDQMLVHGMSVTPRHHQGRCLALAGTDRAEDIGRAGSLVVRRGWPRSTLGPATCDLVLLADTCLILEPNFDHFTLGGANGDFCHCGGEVFLNASAASASCA